MIYNFNNERAWLAYRTDPGAIRIGASEVATILGYGFGSVLELWATKRGVSIPVDAKTVAMFRQGHEDEAPLAAWFQNETGIELIDLGPHTVIQRDPQSWAFCTPDRVILEDGKFIPVELKSVPFGNRSEWLDAAPAKYWVQLQWQMCCMWADRGYIAARTCPEVYHEYEYDAKFIADILPRIEHFRGLVRNGVPPTPDGSESAGRAIKALHPEDNKKVVDLPDFEALAGELETLKERAKTATTEYDKAKQSLELAIGDNTFARCGEKCFSRKTQSRKGTITVPMEYAKALQISNIKHTITDGSTYRVLREIKSLPKEN